MDPYEKWRGSMGYPIDLEMGHAVNKYKDMKLKAINEGSRSNVVKLVCSKGNKRSFFNGFFYNNDSSLILSSGHISGFDNADKYEALFFHGTEFEKSCELTLLHVGMFIRQEVSNTGCCFNVYSPDVAVLKCPDDVDVQIGNSPRPFAEQVYQGASVCIVGYKGVDEPQLSISDGIVSFVGLDIMHVAANADNGYAGSPVLSSQGYVVGMVKGGVGTTIKQVVEVVAVNKIHNFLISKGLPGFKGRCLWGFLQHEMLQSMQQEC
ncbi:hypothetical protein CEUSTIGMA_g6428.t1 [Chlamydomonas eustigma]|uniref:Serine protease n=1 Tax=Chlamydomonas eustigma TaxID=1157962 RepID=A0A250X7D0_9CHLO|nr:hypothetical protein CEUSTIGMA_g6428.t1 [Chlamydomonas eustigma]|eukprot:GAX78988.1 hypothetical protein CEUSTIGMA_g6428.t1 [Chlamydomonas eustigma]